MELPMNRRDLLAAVAGTVVAAGLSPRSVEAADHAGHPGGVHTDLIAAARGCVDVGDDCLAHCLAMFKSGDTTLAACAHAVAEMIPVCNAVAALATLGATRVGQFLGPCIDVCTDCEKECRKHADKHPQCKACADACLRLIAEAKKHAV